MIIKACKILGTIVFVVFIACIQTNTPDQKPSHNGLTTAAACNECHTYPGSILCKSDTLTLNGTPATQCIACHKNSIVLDSSFDTAADAFVFYDKMFISGGKSVQKTGPHHADNSLSLDFTQCTQCHSYPSNSGLHKRHVIDEGKECIDCHFLTVQHDLNDDGTNRYYSQRTQTVPGGKQLPIPVNLYHINNHVNVTFEKNYEIPKIDSLFRYNTFDNSCSNIECHNGLESGGAPVERSIWKEVNQ